MKSEPYSRPARQCVWCHKSIWERDPVFLVEGENGRLLGPYHAHCSWLVKKAAPELVECIHLELPSVGFLNGASGSPGVPSTDEGK